MTRRDLRVRPRIATKVTVPTSSAASEHAAAKRAKHLFRRWFFPGMAMLMLATSIAGFAPGILDMAGRHEPVSALAAIHGIIFLVWLLLFLVQSLLARSAPVIWHRRLGIASLFVLLVMVPIGYATAVAMVQRGSDLSGDQHVGFSAYGPSLDAQTASVFNLLDLGFFALLAAGAFWFRTRLAIHKRLMLFANIQLMGASVTHLLGHTGLLSGGTVIGSFSAFLLVAVARDWVVDRRIHPLTAALAIISFVSLPMEASVISPSAIWHHLVDKLAGVQGKVIL